MNKYSVNYKRIYDKLIRRARSRSPNEMTENHHILPKSMGGDDDLSNLVKLTIREHFLAHLLLAKMYPRQWFSVEAILKDTFNKHSHRYQVPKLRFKNWIRRNIAHTRAKLIRKELE